MLFNYCTHTARARQRASAIPIFFFYPFFPPQFCGIQLVVITVLSTVLLLDRLPIQPGSQPHECVRGNTVHLATWSACTAPGPTQESLVRDETMISLPAKPSPTRTTLGQLCAAPWASRSWSAATEPELKPRISGGTASTAMQCLRPLCHPGGPLAT